MRTIITLFTVLLTINLSAQEKDSTLIFNSTTNDYGFLHTYKPSQKDIEFEIVAPTLFLMELYMEDIRTGNFTCLDCPEPNPRKRQPSFEDFYNWTKQYFKEQLKD